MSKIWCNFVIVLLIITYLFALDPEKCKQKPKEKHCLIEWSVRNRWPHQLRYVYDWVTSKCFEVRWSTHCPAVPSPASTNNFASEDDCFNQCLGWA